LSCCYELGRERTRAGTGTVATWRRREGGGFQSAWHAHEQGRPAGSGTSATEAGNGLVRGAEQRSGERGGVWARGLRSAIVGRPREKEDGPCPKE
jgi:hypothetical protein